jgi:hypothetical protein
MWPSAKRWARLWHHLYRPAPAGLRHVTMSVSMPRASLRTYLLALTAGAVVPVLGFAAYLTIGLSRTQQEAVERGLFDTAATLATGVDRQLAGSITALEALAASEHLDRADYGAFAREA